MRERVNKGLILLLAAGLMAAALCGCVRFESTVDPSVTMPGRSRAFPDARAYGGTNGRAHAGRGAADRRI